MIELYSGRPISELVDEVSARVQTAESTDRHDFDRLLVDFLLTAGRDREAMELLEEMSERDPDDVRSLINKAEYFLLWLKESEQALRCIDLALPRAYRVGVFRRKALNTKASVLLELGQGAQLSQVLEEVMSLEIRKDALDVGPERDFVDRAPPGLISEDILARYDRFCPKRPGHAAADKPSNESPEPAKNDASDSPGQKLKKQTMRFPTITSRLSTRWRSHHGVTLVRRDFGQSW